MIVLLSPAKTLDYESELPQVNATEPAFTDESTVIMNKLKKLSKKKLSALMSLNKDLTELNAMRYQEWEPEFNDEASRPALYAFTGEVYRGLDAKSFEAKDVDFAQEHLRILSGLHGILKPLDKIRPYRLEMGTKLPVGRKKNLYDFWTSKLTETLSERLDAQGDRLVVNLASNEYSKAVDLKHLDARVITPVFKERKGDDYKVVMTYAKNARGAMASYIIRNKITDPEHLKGFESYAFSSAMSSEDEWVFIR